MPVSLITGLKHPGQRDPYPGTHISSRLVRLYDSSRKRRSAGILRGEFLRVQLNPEKCQHIACGRSDSTGADDCVKIACMGFSVFGVMAGQEAAPLVGREPNDGVFEVKRSGNLLLQ